MKLSITLLLACLAVGVVVHGVIDSWRPERDLGTAGLPPVVAEGPLPVRASVPAPKLDQDSQPADYALPVENDSERFAALGKHASSPELANAADAAIANADDEARVQAVELLGDSRQPEYVAILAAALADRNSEVRLAALQALIRHGTDEAMIVLRAGLPHLDEDLREFASAVLADPSSEAMP